MRRYLRHRGDRLRQVSGDPICDPAQTETLAAERLAAGRPVLRRSVGGEPRGVLCAMGVCFECRIGPEQRRACMEPVESRLSDRVAGALAEAISAVPEAPPYDLAVIGAGPAGIAAACAAAESGKRVALLDEGLAPGGQIWRGGRVPPAWRERLERSGVVSLDRATVFDLQPGFAVQAERAGEPLQLKASALVLATGARELFLPFPGWTLPNVVGVGAVQALLKAGLSFRDRRVVLAGSGPLLLPVAALLAEDGADVALVAEQSAPVDVARFARSLWRWPGKLVEAARHRLSFPAARYRPGVWVVEALGDSRVREAVLTDGERVFRERADILGVSFGLLPNTELGELIGCELEAGALRVGARQETSVPGVFAAGEPTGVGGAELAAVEGFVAGFAAAGREAPVALLRRRESLRAFSRLLASAFHPRPELRALARPDTLLCRCEDVPLSALEPSWGARQAKLAARFGMGACQGRTCGPAARFLFGWEGDSVRSPVKPASIGSLVGAHPGRAL